MIQLLAMHVHMMILLPGTGTLSPGLRHIISLKQPETVMADKGHLSHCMHASMEDMYTIKGCCGHCWILTHGLRMRLSLSVQAVIGGLVAKTLTTSSTNPYAQGGAGARAAPVALDVFSVQVHNPGTHLLAGRLQNCVHS